jgi:hypothetical protein
VQTPRLRMSISGYLHARVLIHRLINACTISIHYFSLHSPTTPEAMNM